MANSLHAYCPECDTRIRFRKRPPVGELLTCPECMEELAVTSTRPIELEWAYEELDDDLDTSPSRNGYRSSEEAGIDDTDSRWEDDWQ